jgi:hypothetical protein
MAKTSIPLNLANIRRQIEDMLPANTAFIMCVAEMYRETTPALVTNVPEDDAFKLMRAIVTEKDIDDAVTAGNN